MIDAILAFAVMLALAAFLFASAGEAGTAETVEQGSVHEHATAQPGRPFNATDAHQLRKLEHEAELRWRYGVRHENEPRIRELEQILGKPVSGCGE